MSLTKILWKLGLTKKKSELITPTLINIFKISHKHFYQGNSNLTVDHILGAPNLGLASSGKDIYHINLNNGSKSIVLDNMLIYNSYEVGDLLKLSYQEKYLIISDYVAENLDDHSEIERRLIGYDVIEFEKV